MSIVKQLHYVTEQLSNHLNSGIQDSRDSYIETISELLERRQSLIASFPGTFTEEEKQIGKQIVTLNERVDKKLKEQLIFLKKELDTFQRNKRRQKHYSNPYKDIAVDGMYFDKKK
ncbi:hypothetical protein [Pueribacillus sp. YX66]|uniref:hypothetical protein n=1 Tax=Pueribacillus sp. YX66 TaxID=3229242 RepID=UPI00358D7D35